jgi:hypothetical protein
MNKIVSCNFCVIFHSVSWFCSDVWTNLFQNNHKITEMVLCSYVWTKLYHVIYVSFFTLWVCFVQTYEQICFKITTKLLKWCWLCSYVWTKICHHVEKLLILIKIWFTFLFTRMNKIAALYLCDIFYFVSWFCSDVWTKFVSK